MEGSDKGSFGGFEFLKTLNWSALALAIGMAVVAWANDQLVPLLTSQGGIYAILATVLVAALKAWQQKNTDNTK